VAHIPEDPQQDGAHPNMSVQDNIVLKSTLSRGCSVGGQRLKKREIHS
jgi:ABC-type uncharacterized transport system ATPase subunit